MSQIERSSHQLKMRNEFENKNFLTTLIIILCKTQRLEQLYALNLEDKKVNERTMGIKISR